MTLPKIAQRIPLVLIRRGSDGADDEWHRPTPGPEAIVHAWRGDIQPRTSRELAQADNRGVNVGEFVVFADLFAFLTGDVVMREADAIVEDGVVDPESGPRYEVVRVDRPGEGMPRLDHYELGVTANQRAVT